MNKFEIKDCVDKLIYKSYNIIVDLFFIFDYKAKYILKNNVKFKNINSGERCFILGTGPSLGNLSNDQVEKLQSEIVFGVNSLYKSEIGLKLNPKYYTLIDNLYWETSSSVFKDVADAYKNNPPIFLTDLRAKKIIDSLSLTKDSIYIYSKKYPTQKMSEKITTNIYGAMNVISYSILVAIYMGFSEIYLLGCDYNAFCNQGTGHCYDDKDEMKSSSYNLAFYLKYYHITTEFHYLIAKLAVKKGLKIINLTDTSLLDAYPRISSSVVL